MSRWWLKGDGLESEAPTELRVLPTLFSLGFTGGRSGLNHSRGQTAVRVCVNTSHIPDEALPLGKWEDRDSVWAFSITAVDPVWF